MRGTAGGTKRWFRRTLEKKESSFFASVICENIVFSGGNKAVSSAAGYCNVYRVATSSMHFKDDFKNGSLLLFCYYLLAFSASLQAVLYAKTCVASSCVHSDGERKKTVSPSSFYSELWSVSTVAKLIWNTIVLAALCSSHSPHEQVCLRSYSP